MSIFNNILFSGGLFNGSQLVGVSSDDDIVFNDFGLQNSMITTRYIRHKSGHDTEFIMSNIARSHGVRMQALYRRGKIISVKGTVKAPSHDLLIDTIDSMKKHLKQMNGVLRITRDNRVRKYYATLNNPQGMFENEDAYHVTMIPFELQFFVSFFGFSENRNVLTDEVSVANQSLDLFHDGTADEGRLITIMQINSESSLTVVRWENETTGEIISVTPVGGFSAGDILKIDGENQVVTLNGGVVEYSGIIPTLAVESNTMTITLTSTSHNITITNKFYNYYS